jgi:hypothetical protein
MPEKPLKPDVPEKPLMPDAPESGMTQDKSPDPLVDKTYPDTPPVISTLDIFPKDTLAPVKVTLPLAERVAADILALLSITDILLGPTEKPCIEFNFISAI